jgi:hypothetical protein
MVLLSTVLGVVGLLMTGQALALSDIAEKVKDPAYYLEKLGPLVVMGNAPLDAADVVFLPEIHDDPESLTIQLLLIAQEKKKGKPLMVLDESLGSMKKSIWDVFSQKTLEIAAAREQREKRLAYVPERFEQALRSLASKYKSTSGQLSLQKETGLWTLGPFAKLATPFFGWDYGYKGKSLVTRNQKMVATLKDALKTHNRILLMAGARHIPDLEFLTSQKLLCDNDRLVSMEQYFSKIERKFGPNPELTNGIGATLPIYNFLAAKRYAVVFSQKLYQELDKVVNQFKAKRGAESCLKLP